MPIILAVGLLRSAPRRLRRRGDRREGGAHGESGRRAAGTDDYVDMVTYNVNQVIIALGWYRGRDRALLDGMARRVRAGVLLALIALAACTPTPRARRRRARRGGAAAIADPPDRSAVTGVFTFYSWIAEPARRCRQQLAAVRARLAARGIAVLEPTGAAALPAASRDAARAAVRSSQLEGPALYIAIGKWEAQNTDFPAFVDVALDAELIAPDSGDTVWTTRDAGPLATRGASSLAMAYRLAADAAAARLLDALHGDRSDRSDPSDPSGVVEPIRHLSQPSTPAASLPRIAALQPGGSMPRPETEPE